MIGSITGKSLRLLPLFGCPKAAVDPRVLNWFASIIFWTIEGGMFEEFSMVRFYPTKIYTCAAALECLELVLKF
jgi:hypothetical protein